MQTLRIALLILGLSLVAPPAAADQKDPRLDALFSRLREAPGPANAAPIERKIWTIWIEHPDEKVAALMREGTREMSLEGNFEAALKVFDKVVELAPDFAEGWNKRATVHYLLDNLKASLADIERTLKLEPRHFGALAGRGLVLIKRDNLEQALAAFEEALAVNPQMPGARANAQAIRQVLKQREI